MNSSWAKTITEHHHWLHRWLVSKASPGDPIEDLVQDTLQVAIAQGQPKEPLNDVKGWLAGIARNKLRQHIDNSTRHRRINQTLSGSETTGAMSPDPLAFLLHRERDSLLQSALATLDEETSQLLRAKYLEGASYQDLATRFHWSTDTVTNRLRTARQQLRETLQRLSTS